MCACASVCVFQLQLVSLTHEWTQSCWLSCQLGRVVVVWFQTTKQRRTALALRDELWLTGLWDMPLRTAEDVNQGPAGRDASSSPLSAPALVATDSWNVPLGWQKVGPVTQQHIPPLAPHSLTHSLTAPPTLHLTRGSNLQAPAKRSVQTNGEGAARRRGRSRCCTVKGHFTPHLPPRPALTPHPPPLSLPLSLSLQEGDVGAGGGGGVRGSPADSAGSASLSAGCSFEVATICSVLTWRHLPGLRESASR